MAASAPPDHYENFPVASVLLPARLRPAVQAIYAFARSADDFADEGDLPAEQRLALLDNYRDELDRIERRAPSTDPLFLRLRPHIERHRLPLQLFRDLLDAFARDVTQTRQASYAELLDYCRLSANPVGRLLLQLFDAASALHVAHSDAICSALQLINHWQDVGVDAAKPVPRIYLPQDELAHFGVSEADILCRRASADFCRLMAFQVDRARALMLQGAPLGHALPGRIGLEIRTIVAGGLAILDKLEAVDYDMFAHRPILTVGDWPRLLWRTLIGTAP